MVELALEARVVLVPDKMEELVPEGTEVLV